MSSWCEELESVRFDHASGPVAASDLSTALIDAAVTAELALGESDARARIIRSLELLAADSRMGPNLSTCGHLTVVVHSLRTLPDDPATQPDRDAISLVVGLIAETVARDTH